MVKTKNIYLETKLKNNFLLIKTIKPVKLSGSTIYLTDTVKIFLFWIVSKLFFHIEVNQSKKQVLDCHQKKLKHVVGRFISLSYKYTKKNIYNTVIELQKTIKKS